MTSHLSVTVSIVDQAPIPTPGEAEALESLVRHALLAEGQSGDWDVTVALMSDDGLQRLHRDFMGLDSATDIMTFSRGGDERGGDIAISIDRATAQASEFGMTAWEEVCFLAVHGVLHLTGWDDSDDAARGRMLARQTRIMQSWHMS